MKNLIVLLFAAFVAMSSQDNQKKRVLVLGIDGLRGDVLHGLLKNGQTPGMESLARKGLYVPCEAADSEECARAHGGTNAGRPFKWMTSPGWASVLTGVDNDKHKIRENGRRAQSVFSRTTKKYPTFLKLAKDNGYTVAATGVGAFLSSHKNKKISYGILDFECGVKKRKPIVSVDATSSCNLDYRYSLRSKDPNRDSLMASWVGDLISNGKADVIFPVFDQVDAAGHDHGFGFREGYQKSIKKTDLLVQDLLDLVESRSINNNECWLVVLTSDHGGHTIFGHGIHGRNRFTDSAVPFMMRTFCKEDLLKERHHPVTHMDVHNTVMHFLGLPAKAPDSKVQGF